MSPSVDVVSALYLGIPSLGILVGCVLVYWIRTQLWDRRGSKWFVVTVLIGLALTALQVGYFLVDEPTTLQLLLLAQIVVALTAFSAFAVFVSVYTDRDFHSHPAVMGAIAIVVGGVTVLATTEWLFDHGLLLAEATPVTEPFTYVRTEPGAGFAALVVVLMALIGYSWFVLILDLLQTQHRGGLQLVLLLFAALAVAVTEILGQLGLFPARGFHHAPWGLLPFAVLSAIALFRLRLFDVQPVARNTVVESLHDPILILDREWRLVDYNRTARRLWGSIDERVGEPFESIAGPLVDALSVPTGDETEATQQVTLLDADGRERHYSVTLTTVQRRHSEEVGWYAILLRDVTDIERSRRQLELQNERLDQVSATISHDLRNPIQVADGFTELVIENLRELADEEPTAAGALAKLERVDGAMDRMEDIIENVLAMAREGRAVENPEPVALAAVARDAWTNVETGEATLDVAVDPDWTVAADRGRLLSILENLFRNAVDHGGPSITVTVDAGPGEFVVADDGRGIPDGAAGDIFRYGYSTDAHGTGFGLAIVRMMAESHGWTVSVDETDDEGARFVFDVGAGVGGVAGDERAEEAGSATVFGGDAADAGGDDPTGDAADADGDGTEPDAVDGTEPDAGDSVSDSRATRRR